MDNNFNRATRDEIDFVTNIGKHRSNGGLKNELYRAPKKVLTVREKINMLEGYIESMAKRQNWGDIDSNAVRSHAVRLIEAYKKHL